MQCYLHRWAGLLILLLMFPGGCITIKQDKKDDSSERAYFSSPQNAVPKIAEMLKQSNFKALIRYYDLAGSDISRADLESGDFFVRKKRPEFAHPAGFWRYKHPFSPGFKYGDMQSSVRKNVYVIRVTISIEQGSESPDQEGYSLFYMIKSVHGWQVLPDQVEESVEPEIPSTVQGVVEGKRYPY